MSTNMDADIKCAIDAVFATYDPDNNGFLDAASLRNFLNDALVLFD